ncbi:RNA-binding protein [Synechococcus sp. A10-1-5-1]|uniref:RNA recognition motif domain-containing protein n=1 Tax=Synechococcus sp. A10-1-5-1 TaxID=2936507 RepID=UPI002000CB69|nr:RNA-binding protein [Synechococcus sp. A10-1-5-1]UPM49264.1 RNA-binding protein [Synechococcus sp. A10-1-5-1]
MSIFVGNLPFRAEQEDVAELFVPFGDVANCSLPLERDTGRKRGFAFVELVDPDSEDRAIEALQGAELMGRPLRINKAEPRSGGGGGGGGAPRRVGVYGGGYDSNPAPAPRVDRPSGAQGWEDRSYGSQNDSFGEGRTRRRRSSYQGD